ncbi:MAG: hypothetical protein WCO45_07435 [Pseudanabaena sp. ELA607]
MGHEGGVAEPVLLPLGLLGLGAGGLGFGAGGLTTMRRREEFVDLTLGEPLLLSFSEDVLLGSPSADVLDVLVDVLLDSPSVDVLDVLVDVLLGAPSFTALGLSTVPELGLAVGFDSFRVDAAFGSLLPWGGATLELS